MVSGRTANDDGEKPKEKEKKKKNAYEDQNVQEPSAPGVYADTVEEEAEDYEYIDESDLHHGRQPPPARHARY